MEQYFVYFIVAFSGLAIVALALGIATFIQISKLRRFQRQFFQGSQGQDLEGIIADLGKHVDKLDQDIGDLFNASNQINKLALRGLSNIGLLRFNPFGEKGHKNSFALAIVNRRKSGLVISSLKTEGGTNIFVKKIIKGKSDIQLTKEEAEAIEIAK